MPGTLAGLFSILLACFVLRRAAGQHQGYALGYFLLAHGLARSVFLGIEHFAASPDTLETLHFLNLVFLLAEIPAYLFFLGTVPTPLASPWRSGGAMLAVSACCSALLVSLFTSPRLWHGGMRAVADGGWVPIYGPFNHVVNFAVIVLSLYGLVVAVSAYRRASSPLQRQRAGWYAAAFAAHDGLVFAWLAIGYAVFFVAGGQHAWDAPGWRVAGTIGNATWTTILAALLAYGMLKHQLFDIDLKIKWGIRRGTLVGIFVAVFVVIAAIVEQWLQRYGVLLGGVAVGLLLLALRPLERAADRLANAAMPGVRDDAEYRTVRKREVYRAAVESALVDGAITDKERDVLATLATQLGLTPEEMRSIERESAAAA